MPSNSKFDTKKPHILTTLQITTKNDQTVFFSAIVDTGAPYTELSDLSLARTGYSRQKIQSKSNPFQETHKYSKIKLVEAFVLGQTIKDWTVYVSRFDPHWGIDALIGLDFFRRFRVTIDYSKETLTVEPFYTERHK